MHVDEIMEQLVALGSPSIKKVLINHGAKEPFYGVKVQDLKKIQAKVKKDYELSKSLYNTGISDAMYLAGLIADEKKMTEADLRDWAAKAPWQMIIEYTVPWITAETPHGPKLATEWINTGDEHFASIGWATWSNIVAITKDEQLDIPFLQQLIERVVKTIHAAPNRVRYTMNSFVIAAGSYVPALTTQAMAAGKSIGEVEVNLGNTACKVPGIIEYIDKVKAKNYIGKKKKMARC
ncbi:3-methyladenine DNA glycosylase AlkD [Chitinophaga skermanii]|uniref:3-methyladenine DNA glycosylase AlkD n=1 Tax=Chitinophaga skermanii TaxID=331697 RepID=A0A327QRX3_9BACT|nr:DNA alkylation repair protein [Chitinophaga skermanii]RAJ06708.1 3-methyladenine DNA glycosylase AlkD [Chitinophaga skermanii]